MLIEDVGVVSDFYEFFNDYLGCDADKREKVMNKMKSVSCVSTTPNRFFCGFCVYTSVSLKNC